MVFSSITFLFYFLPVVLAIYYLVPKKLKNAVLLIASMAFYFFGEPKYLIIMIISIIQAYILGLLIDKNKERTYKKIYLIISIIFQAGILIYVKYIDFLIENINLILKNKLDLVNVILPIGISFYTFQIMSYVIDIYKEKIKVQKNIFTLATYVMLFPQLIAGPIVRYKDIENSLETRENNIEDIAKGIRRFVIGLGKKVLIANLLGELINIFYTCNDKTVIFYWIYGITNMLQIYFDFSGYSDMAIGLGKMFGFEFLENFNYPYISTSITEFWRRWHISLSTWFRDYVYIPLGGNRKGKKKQFRNILIVWMLTGLWHGAAWNFVIWGMLFGILLIIEKEIILKHTEKFPKAIKILATLFIVMISFIIFSGESISQITDNLSGLFGIGTHKIISKETIYYLKSYSILLIIAIIGATPLMKNIVSKDKLKKLVNILEPVFILVILVLSTSYIVDGSFNPFLYFRF